MFINLKGDIIEKRMRHLNNWIILIGIICGIITMIIGFITAPEGGILFFAGATMCVFGYISYIQVHTIYTLCRDGIWVKYPFESEQLIYWEEFHQVLICNQNCRMGQYVYIAFIREGVTFDPKRGAESQSVFKARRIMITDYTDVLYEDVKKYCPYEIKDIRKPIKAKEYTGIRY